MGYYGSLKTKIKTKINFLFKKNIKNFVIKFNEQLIKCKKAYFNYIKLSLIF